MLSLKAADLRDLEAIWDFYREIPEDENGFTNPDAGCTREKFSSRVLPRIVANARGEDLPEGFVPETAYFLWEDGRVVGLFRLRHRLNDFLREHAGHTGYCIRRDARGRGLAAKGLSMLVEIARGVVEEDTLYLSVNRDNLPSYHTQLKCGAKLHHSDETKHYTRIPLRD